MSKLSEKNWIDLNLSRVVPLLLPGGQSLLVFDVLLQLSAPRKIYELVPETAVLFLPVLVDDG